MSSASMEELPIVAAGGANRPVRHAVSLSVSFDTAERVGNAIVQDLSREGLLLQTEEVLRLGLRINVELPHQGTAVATIVWKGGNVFGCKFAKPITSAAVSAARLKSSALILKMPEMPAPPERTGTSVAIAVGESTRRSLGVSRRIQLIIFINLMLWAAVAIIASVVL